MPTSSTASTTYASTVSVMNTDEYIKQKTWSHPKFWPDIEKSAFQRQKLLRFWVFYDQF